MCFRNREFSSQDDDVGLVYTRDEFGGLNTPSGYELTFGDKSYLHDIEPRAASCSTKDQNGRNSPRSLYSISLDFVARNIDMVESLCGFPDIVGKDIFDRLQLNGGFTQTPSQTFQLFVDAYGSLVLDKLSLNGQYLAVSEWDYLNSFSCLSELDLSHCSIGSHHELLLHISKMSSLLRLSLKDNCLNDNDIQVFTIPLRVTRVGLSNLLYLDLSCNPGISHHAMRYLTHFQSLVGLNLTDTGVSVNNDLQKLTRRTGLVVNPKFKGFDDTASQIQTEGWASSVIKDWLLNLKTMKRQPTQDATNSKVKAFYTKERKSNIAHKKNSKSHKLTGKEYPSIIILTKADGSQIDAVFTGQEKPKETNGRKGWKKNGESLCQKRKQHPDEDAFLEHEIMQSYMNNGKTVNQNKKCKLSLLDLNY